MASTRVPARPYSPHDEIRFPLGDTLALVMARILVACAVALATSALACGGNAPPKEPALVELDAGPSPPAIRIAPEEADDTKAARKRLLKDCANGEGLAEARAKNEDDCTKGEALACSEAAKAYLCGADREHRGEAAERLFQRGCALRDGRACTAAAYLFEHALEVPRDAPRAAMILEKACADDVEEACNGYTALLLARTRPLAAPVVRVLGAACERGNAEACAALASVVQTDHEDVKADPSLAFGAAEKACQAKNAVGCAGLASFLSLGIGTKKDPRRAATIAERACREGVALGCRLAYFAYDKGEGVPKDEAKAKDFLRRSCAIEVTESCREVR